MNAIFHRLLASVVLGTAAGCFSLESSPLSRINGESLHLASEDGKPTEHVVVSNFGWYFFNRWPIVCGDARSKSWGSFTFFRDDVEEALLQDRFMSYAAERGCCVSDLTLMNTEEVLMTIGIGGLSIPLPYIISFRDMQYSGVLMKPLTEQERLERMSPRQRLNQEMKDLLKNIPDGGTR